MLSLLARINYALARGVLHGYLSSLLTTIPIAGFLLVESGRWRTGYWLFVHAIFAGLSGGFLSAAFLGLFMAHDPFQGDLRLGRKCRSLSIAAAIIGVCAVFLFHVSGYDTTRFIPQMDWAGLIEFARARPKLILWALAIAFVSGRSVRPPRFLLLPALNYFTIWDFLRGCHPHHDEDEATDLPVADHARLHAEAAVWWAYRGQAPRARFEWAEALRLGELHAGDYKDCASFFAAVSDLNQAEKVIRQGLSRFPENVSLRYGLTDILELQNLPAEAEAEYRKILSIAPDHQLALHAYGNILHKQGRPDEALEHYSRAVAAADSSDSNIVRFLNSRGAAFATLGKHDDAEEDFVRAIQLGRTFYSDSGEPPAGFRDSIRNLGTLHGLRRRSGSKPRRISK